MEHQLHINAIKSLYETLQGENRLPQNLLLAIATPEPFEQIRKHIVWLANFTPHNRIWKVHALICKACGLSDSDSDSVFECMIRGREGGIGYNGTKDYPAKEESK